MTKTVPIDDAVGMVLPHDITEIRPPGTDADAPFKGRAFKKGHIIRPEDLAHLKKIGKENVYVLTLEDDEIHEDEAAKLLAKALCGKNTRPTGEPSEGKINIITDIPGLLKVNAPALFEFNLLGDLMGATLHNNTVVNKGDTIAATRLIPLIAGRHLVNKAVSIAEKSGGIVSVKSFKKARAGLVITGNEVFFGKIKDAFEPVLRKKLAGFGAEIVTVRFAPDNAETIAGEITNCLENGVDLIVTSGGMSVDPDDVTRHGIMLAGAENIVYGTPVLPGAMFLSGMIGDIPVLGLPACGMFHNITVFDLILPRILAGERITRSDVAAMGHGGLCRQCKECVYPVCGFGK